jgi:hypothetical protein
MPCAKSVLVYDTVPNVRSKERRQLLEPILDDPSGLYGRSLLHEPSFSSEPLAGVSGMCFAGLAQRHNSAPVLK